GSIAVVVDPIAANFGDQARNIRVPVVAIAPRRAIAVGVAVSVGVPWNVRALIGRLVARVDRARRAVGAGDRLPWPTTDDRHALLRTVAICPVIALCVVWLKVTEVERRVANVGCARRVVVTRPIVDTRSSPFSGSSGRSFGRTIGSV